MPRSSGPSRRHVSVARLGELRLTAAAWGSAADVQALPEAERSRVARVDPQVIAEDPFRIRDPSARRAPSRAIPASDETRAGWLPRVSRPAATASSHWAIAFAVSAHASRASISWLTIGENT